MARIYDERTEELHVLLDKAARNEGATLVIPDLQRPYVWTPSQVSLLIDSLIRGWPFGTLLLWSVEHDEKRNIPSRAFWKIVDGTGEDSGHTLLQDVPPATYQMVLDGQQRVQSLLLATHGASWGFKLTDKDWGVEVGSKSAKGKTNKKYWTLGSLCLDLRKFFEAYNEAGQQISGLEFEKALVWAITDEADGKSKAKTAATYKRPIPERYATENKANLIRFSRLWKEAGMNPNFKEKNYHEGITQVLTQHGVSEEDQGKYLPPLAELMTTLRDVKLQKVAFLELRAFDKTISRDAYDDAIVNIFTRLNTAGRTLTREEITFAWLKVGWKPELTSNRSAQRCFKDLQGELKSHGLDLDIDDLVSAVSFNWAVAHNNGKMLTNRDLLQGEIIRPMAEVLSGEWDLLAITTCNVTRIVKERELGKGKLLASLNALEVFWAAHLLFMKRASQLVSGEMNKDSLQKRADGIVNLYIDRWFVASSWAQRWASSGGKALPGYASAIAADTNDYNNATTVDACVDLHRRRLEALIAEVQDDAETHINSRLEVEVRENVSQYFGALWLWHRLGVSKWKASSVSLRIGAAKEDLEVDHLVSVKIWNSKEAPEGLLSEDESLGSIMNSLGNCALLQKSFNIIKSGGSLRTFMNKVHEFKDSPEKVEPWASDLGITRNQLDGDKAEIRQLVEDVRIRDQQIRTDLVRFVRGELQRADLEISAEVTNPSNIRSTEY